jgi:hypothetical protein
MKNLNEKNLVQKWIKLKKQEAAAVEQRRKIENQLLELKGLSELDKSTEIYRDDNVVLTARPSISYAVDQKALSERINSDPEFAKLVEMLFRKKYELNLDAYKFSAPESVKPILPYVTAKYLRPTFTLAENKKGGNDV